MSDAPIGKRESLRLEFRGAEVLRKPLKVAREAVGMLNAAGGEIWIGLREQDGVATAVEPIADAEKQRLALLTHLIDSIEPTPGSTCIDVAVVRDAEGQGILRVRVTPGQMAGPYALLSEGGRHFLVRIDHRLRPMTREEIFGVGASPSKRNQAVEKARTALRLRRDEKLKRPWGTYWIGMQPVPALAVETQDPRLAHLLSDPTLSGNRRSGWNFRFPLVPPRLEAGGLLQLGDPKHRLTQIFPEGGIDLTQAVDHLAHRMEQKKEIHPLAVLEYVISMCRLGKAVYQEVAASPPEAVLMDMAVVGASGWHLPPYAPGTFGHLMEHETPREVLDGSYLRTEPLEAPFTDLVANPDRIGFRIVRSFYQELGLPEDRIPSAYDRERELLLLKD